MTYLCTKITKWNELYDFAH